MALTVEPLNDNVISHISSSSEDRISTVTPWREHLGYSGILKMIVGNLYSRKGPQLDQRLGGVRHFGACCAFSHTRSEDFPDNCDTSKLLFILAKLEKPHQLQPENPGWFLLVLC